MIDVVSATRLSRDDFWDKSALGNSLKRLAGDDRIASRVFFSNQTGLPERYNECIRSDDSDEILVFMHDDVWIDDYFLADRVLEGLRSYDLIGVAGVLRRIPGQPPFANVDPHGERPRISGAIAQGPSPFAPIQVWESAPADCDLLDGVFLAARTSVLREHRVLFDPEFDFHLHDADFCRAAKRAGLRVGTWPISLTHQSAGSYRSDGWWKAFERYLAKWGD